jgi:carbon-monoxide dehydrogenase large subunit
MVGRFTGQSIERVEDARLLRGKGRFTASISKGGMRHVAFVRSPHAHARITGIDPSAALALPGVVAVLTADDLAKVMTGPMQIMGPPALKVPRYHPLATDKVRLVGDPVAMVVADTEAIAHDGAHLVQVDYAPLPPVVDMAGALAATGDAQLWDDIEHNLAFRETSSWGDVDAVFAAAERVVTRRFVQHRSTHAPMEPRCSVATFDGSSFLYEASHKRPHPLKMNIAALFAIPFPDVRVVARDIGGGFGSKGQVTREDMAVCAAARILGGTVRWNETRSENLATAGHAREETLELDYAVEPGGRVRGVRVRMSIDVGAYPMLPFPPSMFSGLVKFLLPNAYKFEAYQFDTDVLYTNKGSYVSYRGPWAVETWVREAMFDAVARELDMTPEDVRRVNIFSPPDLPATGTIGVSLKHITARETLERAIELMDLPTFRAEQAAARAAGRLVGLGFATFIEIAPGPPDFAKLVGFDLPGETASVRIEPTGHVVVQTWQVSQGQGHETTMAQMVADEMGVPLHMVRIDQGDSAASPFNTMSTGGSRSATMGAGAAVSATRAVKQQVLAIAAHLLEASEHDLEVVDGTVQVKGTPARAIGVGDIARTAWFAPSMLPPGQPQGLEATEMFRVPEGGWSAATHCCWVEIDPETGAITIPRYLVAEDCGTLINPAVVDGQITGGVMQGLAHVLYEKLQYDADGQLVTSSLADYLVPSAADLPSIEIEHMEFEPTHEINSRGVGEGGMIGSPAALCNAVSDALAHLGIEVEVQDLAPQRVREMLTRAIAH